MKPLYPAFVNPVVRSESRKVISLGGDWKLRIDPNNIGAREQWFGIEEDFEYPIAVPGSVFAVKELYDEYPSYSNQSRYSGTCWLQRKFKLDAFSEDGKLWLKFGGVSPSAHIWLNEHYLGFHQHPIVGFKFDVTEYASMEGENVLTIELTAISDLNRRRSICGGYYTGGPSIYGDVEIEQSPDIHIEDLFVRPRIDEKEVWVTAKLLNDSPESVSITPEIRVNSCSADDDFERESKGDDIEIEAGAFAEISLKADMGDCKLWTPDAPNLYLLTLDVVSNGKLVDEAVERFGMRSIAVENKKLVLNHEPFFWRASSPELMRVPTIISILDKDLIRKRIQAMKDMGFNGNRLHTHVYPREALDICDEMGFILQVEPSVISNFHEVTPYPENRLSFVSKVKEVRNHASVAVFCMGNENSQILNNEGENYIERAKVHLEDIRDLVPDHLILTGVGHQGEFPHVYNDFQTPHLWSRTFKWSYGGLTLVPWLALKHLSDEGPIVLHEYGKLTSWPDPAEDKIYRDKNMPAHGNFGEMGLNALRDAGMEHLLSDVLENSRKLSAVGTKILLEAPRRQPGLQGYQYHCVFRVAANRGFIDDFGEHIDPQFSELPNSNGDTSLLIDRDFGKRVMTTGEPVEINFYLSHFGTEDIRAASLKWSLEIDGKQTVMESIEGLSFEHGKNDKLQKIRFVTPEGMGKFKLCASLLCGDVKIAENNWDFWRFPFPEKHVSEHILIEGKDYRWEEDMIAHFPNLRRVDNFLDCYQGKKWESSTYEERLKILTSGLIMGIVADEWTGRIADYVKEGGTALLIDRGNLPEEWYVQPQTPASTIHHIQYDQYKRYMPFRAGWDHGNTATIIHEHPALGDFPHEGWCDLNCFDMIEGASTLKMAELPGEVAPIIRVIPSWHSTYSGVQEGPSPAEWDAKQIWCTEERCYLAESKIGKGKLLVCSLKLLNNTTGQYIMERIVEYIDSKH